MIVAVVTDIEGTTSSIDFVHKVLFPYSVAALPEFIRGHAASAELSPWIKQIADEIEVEPSDLDAVIAQLLGWIAEDRKHTALKAVQGMIWQTGYAQAEFRAHVYPEVPAALRRWQAAGLDLYVYSSGSIAAQRMFFAHTEAGDLLGLFKGHFDTTSGGKRDIDSYQRIAAAIGAAPQQLLFLSDIVEELDAARAAGWHTTLLQRECIEVQAEVNGHRGAENFDGIDPKHMEHGFS